MTFEPEKFFEDLVQVDITIPKHPKDRCKPLYPGDTINNTTVRLYFHVEDEKTIVHFLEESGAQIALWSYWKRKTLPLVKDVYEYKGPIQFDADEARKQLDAMEHSS